ncbi:hypothetical protein ACXYMU_00565 [Pontibacter sp. CAU 1760]
MHTNSIYSSLMVALLALGACQTQKPTDSAITTTETTTSTAGSKPVWQSDAYSIYRDSVVQGDFVARALSATELTSNYQSPANAFVSPRITFKFAINGRDNEMVSGKDHHFNCVGGDGSCATPVITFGQQLNDTTTAQRHYAGAQRYLPRTEHGDESAPGHAAGATGLPEAGLLYHRHWRQDLQRRL